MELTEINFREEWRSKLPGMAFKYCSTQPDKDLA
jgi:hypothetical protein